MPGVVKLNPDSVLYDEDGHPVGVVLDGAIYRLQTRSQIETQSKGETPVGYPTSAAIDSDKQGLHVLQTTNPEHPNWDNKVIVVDEAGHMVGLVLDGSIYRFQTDSKIAKGNSDLIHLDALDTTSGRGRLKASLYTPEGEAVAFPSVPADASAIRNDFVKNGTSPNLLVDGSTTPVVFTYEAHASQNTSLQELHFTLASNSITFGSNYFGAVSGPLTNGLLVEITSGGVTGTVANLIQNEDFVTFSSPGGFQWVVSSKDLLSSAYLIGGGLVLKGGTSDKVKITVRDDIDSAGVYLRCFVKGNLLAG